MPADEAISALTEPFSHWGPFIYFLQAQEAPPVKIGTSSNIPQRVAALQPSWATPLIVRTVIRGGRKEERGLHYLFREHRLHGEWFANADEILTFANQVRDEQIAHPECKDSYDEVLRRKSRHELIQQRYNRGDKVKTIAQDLGTTTSFLYDELRRMRTYGYWLPLRQPRYHRPDDPTAPSDPTPPSEEADILARIDEYEARKAA